MNSSEVQLFVNSLRSTFSILEVGPYHLFVCSLKLCCHQIGIITRAHETFMILHPYHPYLLGFH
jgi:hypothetical protein